MSLLCTFRDRGCLIPGEEFGEMIREAFGDQDYPCVVSALNSHAPEYPRWFGKYQLKSFFYIYNMLSYTASNDEDRIELAIKCIGIVSRHHLIDSPLKASIGCLDELRSLYTGRQRANIDTFYEKVVDPLSMPREIKWPGGELVPWSVIETILARNDVDILQHIPSEVINSFYGLYYERGTLKSRGYPFLFIKELLKIEDIDEGSALIECLAQRQRVHPVGEKYARYYGSIAFLRLLPASHRTVENTVLAGRFYGDLCIERLQEIPEEERVEVMRSIPDRMFTHGEGEYAISRLIELFGKIPREEREEVSEYMSTYVCSYPTQLNPCGWNSSIHITPVVVCLNAMMSIPRADRTDFLDRCIDHHEYTRLSSLMKKNRDEQQRAMNEFYELQAQKEDLTQIKAIRAELLKVEEGLEKELDVCHRPETPNKAASVLSMACLIPLEHITPDVIRRIDKLNLDCYKIEKNEMILAFRDVPADKRAQVILTTNPPCM